MEWVWLVAGLALVEYMVFSGFVGWARGRFGVHAPAVSGHPEFERYFRVQQNTLEQLIVFLPALFLFAAAIRPGLAASVGVLFLVGRVLYFVTYVRDPARRTVGFLLGFLANAILVLGALGAAARLALTGS